MAEHEIIVDEIKALERRLTAAHAEMARLRRERDRLGHQNDELVGVVRLVAQDGDPCSYDHHGYCQAHYLDPRPCRVEKAKEIIARSSSPSLNYDGPDPSVECAYYPCRNRLRQSEEGGPQWCSQEHRELTAVPHVKVVVDETVPEGSVDVLVPGEVFYLIEARITDDNYGLTRGTAVYYAPDPSLPDPPDAALRFVWRDIDLNDHPIYLARGDVERHGGPRG